MGNCWNLQLLVEESRNNASSVVADGDDEGVKKMQITPSGTPEEEQFATGKEILEEKKGVIEGEEVDEGESGVEMTSSVLPTKRKQQIVSFIADSNQEKQTIIRRKGTPHRGNQLQDSDSQLDTRDVYDLPYHIDDDIQKESIPNETDDITSIDKPLHGLKSENFDSAASSPAKTDAVIEKQKLTKVQLSNAYADAANRTSSNTASINSKVRHFFGLSNIRAKYAKKSDEINTIQQSTDDSNTAATKNEVEESHDEESK